jgi:hypothetical protein
MEREWNHLVLVDRAESFIIIGRPLLGGKLKRETLSRG